MAFVQIWRKSLVGRRPSVYGLSMSRLLALMLFAGWLCLGRFILRVDVRTCDLRASSIVGLLVAPIFPVCEGMI